MYTPDEIKQIITNIQSTLNKVSSILNSLYQSGSLGNMYTHLWNQSATSEEKNVINKFTYYFKYSPISTEIFDWRDYFIEDWFYYRQSYFDYYKLLLYKSQFDFDVYDTNFDKHELGSKLGGQVYLKLEQFPIVIVEPVNYQFTPSATDNLPFANRTITFGLLSHILEPTPGDLVNVLGIVYMITNVQTDVFHHQFVCKQVDLWSIDEFKEHYEKRRTFVVFENVSELEDIQITKTSQPYQFIFTTQVNVDIPKSNIIINKIETNKNNVIQNSDDTNLAITFLD